MVALLAQWKRMDGLAEEQAIMIDALSKDFSLDYTQIFVLCQSRATSWNVIASLQSSLPPGNQLETYMCRRLIPSSCDYVRMLQKSASLFSFNANNPTGHYRLDLSNPIDYSVAEKLAILDNLETALRSRDGKPDVSQLGNFSHCRNVQYSNCPLPRSFTEWIPVEFDVLELDYSSSKRPSNETSAPQAVPLADTVFEQLLRAMLQSVVSSSQAKLQALQQLSDKFFLNCSQLRQLVDLFKESGTRQCVFVCFFQPACGHSKWEACEGQVGQGRASILDGTIGICFSFSVYPTRADAHTFAPEELWWAAPDEFALEVVYQRKPLKHSGSPSDKLWWQHWRVCVGCSKNVGADVQCPETRGVWSRLHVQSRWSQCQGQKRLCRAISWLEYACRRDFFCRLLAQSSTRCSVPGILAACDDWIFVSCFSICLPWWSNVQSRVWRWLQAQWLHEVQRWRRKASLPISLSLHGFPRWGQDHRQRLDEPEGGGRGAIAQKYPVQHCVNMSKPFAQSKGIVWILLFVF